jgi:NADH-quinone oxidoreductase subunit K
MTILILSAALFSAGLYGVLVRRDIIAILASVEVMLAGPVVLLVSVAASLAAGLGDGSAGETSAAATAGGTVQAVGLIIVVIAAAEAAVGLALLVAVARTKRSARLDELTEVRG